jgi:hydrogenase assembly chaperone HypC/HupF
MNSAVLSSSVPGRVVKVEGRHAIADFFGKRIRVSTDLVKVRKGDYILAYSGYAMEKLTEKEAKRILEEVNGDIAEAIVRLSEE